MHAELQHFLRQLAGVVTATLVPVVLTTILCLPPWLGSQPAEVARTEAAAAVHMT